MADLTWHVGDTRTVLATLEPASVDLVVTSPPFLALRSYLPADDPAKPFEMGSEPTPGAFLDALLDVVEACARVLAPHGSMCFELGDTYSGSGGAGGDYGPAGLREGQPAFDGSAARLRTPGGDDRGRPLAKSLCLIPELFRVALVYGHNPLTGRETPRWRARNVIRWVHPNPPVGALGDKWRPATSEMVVVCKASDRYFDQDATRGPHQSDPDEMGRTMGHFRATTGLTGGDARGNGHHVGGNPAGAPLLDWWKISPKGYAGSHYAVFPAALCIPPIRAMCPERVCRECGKPSRRITGQFTLDSYRATDRPQTMRAVALADAAGLTDEHILAVRAFGTSDAGKAQVTNNGFGHNTERVTRLATEAKEVLGGYFREFVMSTNVTREHTWTDCGHATWRPGVVLDPFAGSGTVLDAALGQGRSAIGIDLDRRNINLARDRLGMFPLSVVDHLTTAANP